MYDLYVSADRNIEYKIKPIHSAYFNTVFRVEGFTSAPLLAVNVVCPTKNDLFFTGSVEYDFYHGNLV